MSVRMSAISVAAIFSNHGNSWAGPGALPPLRECNCCSTPFRLIINGVIFGISLLGPRVEYIGHIFMSNMTHSKIVG